MALTTVRPKTEQEQRIENMVLGLPRIAYKFDTFGLEIKAIQEDIRQTVVFYVAGAWTHNPKARKTTLLWDGCRPYFYDFADKHYLDEFIQA